MLFAVSAVYSAAGNVLFDDIVRWVDCVLFRSQDASMNASIASGGLPALTRLLLRTADNAIVAFNHISDNTAHPYVVDFNATKFAQPVLRVLDVLASNVNEAYVLSYSGS